MRKHSKDRNLPFEGTNGWRGTEIERTVQPAVMWNRRGVEWMAHKHHNCVCWFGAFGSKQNTSKEVAHRVWAGSGKNVDQASNVSRCR